MSISGVGLKLYQNNVATTKSTKNVNSTEKTDGFAGKVTEKGSVSPEDMTLEEYKEYFNLSGYNSPQLCCVTNFFR